MRAAFELRVYSYDSFYIDGPLNFHVVLVTLQLSPSACLQVNANNSTLIACNGSATICTLTLSAFAYPQKYAGIQKSKYSIKSINSY